MKLQLVEGRQIDVHTYIHSLQVAITTLKEDHEVIPVLRSLLNLTWSSVLFHRQGEESTLGRSGTWGSSHSQSKHVVWKSTLLFYSIVVFIIIATKTTDCVGAPRSNSRRSFFLALIIWYGIFQDVFKGLEDEADEDLEISQMVEEYKNKGGTILGWLLPYFCSVHCNLSKRSTGRKKVTIWLKENGVSLVSLAGEKESWIDFILYLSLNSNCFIPVKF